MVLQVPFECPGRVIIGELRCVSDLVAAKALRHVHDDFRLFCRSGEVLAYFSADTRVVRDRLGFPDTVPVVAHARLRDAAARAVVGHHEFHGTTHDLFVYVDAGIVTRKFDRHTSPIIGNFQRLKLIYNQFSLGIVRKKATGATFCLIPA